MFIHPAKDGECLSERWLSLCARLNAHRLAAGHAWQALFRRYSEPHRAYHNLSHVAALLQHASEMRKAISQPEVVELAIWFHDAIYDTRTKDNELRSAALAADVMRSMNLDQQLIPPVEQCIRATERHEVSSPSCKDLALFLDLDLAILGSAEQTYRAYAGAIRREYEWVPDNQYRAGRAAVLRRFLLRPRLYFTPAMSSRFEAAARNNIESELRELSPL